MIQFLSHNSPKDPRGKTKQDVLCWVRGGGVGRCIPPDFSCRTSKKNDRNLGGSGRMPNFHEDNVGRAGPRQLPGIARILRKGKLDIESIILSF